jgi:cell wall-associated NlpC family hydrolase
MTRTSLTALPSVRRPRSFGGVVMRAALAAAAVTTGLMATGTSASAQQVELPVNALAPFITQEADQAVRAYDEYIASGELEDYLDYAALRTATARLAAKQLGSNEFAMIDAWKSTSLEHQRAVLAAMTQIGVPYKRNASSEDVAFDCSGLTLYAWQSAGIQLNRVSRDQIRAATTLDREDAKAGDLVHYPGHVMMYLGVDDAVVHTFSTGRTVEIDTLSTRTARRVTFGDPFESGSEPDFA